MKACASKHNSRPATGAILLRLFAITASLALFAFAVVSNTMPSCYPLTDDAPAMCR